MLRELIIIFSWRYHTLNYYFVYVQIFVFMLRSQGFAIASAIVKSETKIILIQWYSYDPMAGKLTPRKEQQMVRVRCNIKQMNHFRFLMCLTIIKFNFKHSRSFNHSPTSNTFVLVGERQSFGEFKGIFEEARQQWKFNFDSTFTQIKKMNVERRESYQIVFWFQVKRISI